MWKKLYLLLFGISITWSGFLLSFDIGPISLYPLRILIMVAFILLLMKSKYIFIDNKIDILTIILFSIISLKSLLSLLWTTDLINSVSTFLMYLTGFSIIIICSVIISNKNDLQIILIGYSLSILLVCIMGVYEIYSGDYIFNLTEYNYQYQLNNFGLNFPLVHTYNINNLATILVVSIPIINTIETEYNKILYFYKIMTFALITFNVIMSGSRGAIFSLLIILMFYIGDYLKTKRISNALLLFILFPFMVLLLPTINGILNANIFEDARFIIWDNVFSTLMNSLFLGVGVGNTGLVNITSTGIDTNVNYSAHNYLLEIFSDFGLMTIIIFLGWIFFLFKQAKNIPKENNSRLFLVLFIFISLVPSTMTGMYSIWLGFGIIISQIKMTKKKYDITNNALNDSLYNI